MLHCDCVGAVPQSLWKIAIFFGPLAATVAKRNIHK